VKKEQGKRPIAAKDDQLLIEENGGIYFYASLLDPVAHYVCSSEAFDHSKMALLHDGWQLLK
jgi:hypothetical protein